MLAAYPSLRIALSPTMSLLFYFLSTFSLLLPPNNSLLDMCVATIGEREGGRSASNKCVGRDHRACGRQSNAIQDW